ncbi:Mob1/phocein family [Fragilaria crotonensis]|nr:Mob1/phocein family [Fragilaria crotonensis]
MSVSTPMSTGNVQRVHHPIGTTRDRLHSLSKRTLGTGGSIHKAVALPSGESCAGWVAAHAIDFYNDVILIWHVMACDPYISCFKPGEGFPSGVEYRWAPNPDGPAISVSAPDYVNLVLKWIEEQLNDPTKFPVDAEDEMRVFHPDVCGALRPNLPSTFASTGSFIAPSRPSTPWR